MPTGPGREDSQWQRAQVEDTASGKGPRSRGQPVAVFIVLIHHCQLVSSSNIEAVVCPLVSTILPTLAFICLWMSNKVKGGHSHGNEPELDLHGMNRHQAVPRVREFLNDQKTKFIQRRGPRWVSVITGRGAHSPGGVPVLRTIVIRYLKQAGFLYRLKNKGGRLHVDLI
ncbi:NEDD4-binding protein 2 [Bulinus truncatus]|nr:NEDD4-binding protein 2 [Bulinus truncatus]